jgi:hypothetical protein
MFSSKAPAEMQGLLFALNIYLSHVIHMLMLMWWSYVLQGINVKQDERILRDQVKGSSNDQLHDLMEIERVVADRWLERTRNAQSRLNYARKRVNIIKKEIIRRNQI